MSTWKLPCHTPSAPPRTQEEAKQPAAKRAAAPVPASVSSRQPTTTTWVEGTDKSGNTYYYNEESGQYSRTRPAALDNGPTASATTPTTPTAIETDVADELAAKMNNANTDDTNSSNTSPSSSSLPNGGHYAGEFRAVICNDHVVMIGGSNRATIGSRGGQICGVNDVWAVPCSDLRTERWFRLQNLPYPLYHMATTVIEY
jgi:hypothetical protein